MVVSAVRICPSISQQWDRKQQKSLREQLRAQPSDSGFSLQAGEVCPLIYIREKQHGEAIEKEVCEQTKSNFGQDERCV